MTTNYTDLEIGVNYGASSDAKDSVHSATMKADNVDDVALKSSLKQGTFGESHPRRGGTSTFDTVRESLPPLALYESHGIPDPKEELDPRQIASLVPCTRCTKKRRWFHRRAQDPSAVWDPAQRPGLNGHCLYSCLAWHLWQQSSVKAAMAMRRRLAVHLLRPESGDLLSTWSAREGVDPDTCLLNYVLHGWGWDPGDHGLQQPVQGVSHGV